MVTITPPQIHDSMVHIQEGGVHLELTVVDTPGFGDIVDNSNWLACHDYTYNLLVTDTGLVCGM